MTGKQRSSGQLARDRRRISNLYLQGWIQADIAQETKLSQSTISRDIVWLQKEWLKSSLIDINARKSQELAKVDRLEREYWTAWERSREDAETVTEKGKGKQKEIRDFEKTIQRKGQAGDARFLAGVQWCIDRRCKILGVDAPVKQQHSGQVDVNVLTIFEYLGE